MNNRLDRDLEELGVQTPDIDLDADPFDLLDELLTLLKVRADRSEWMAVEDEVKRMKGNGEEMSVLRDDIGCCDRAGGDVPETWRLVDLRVLRGSAGVHR